MVGNISGLLILCDIVYSSQNFGLIVFQITILKDRKGTFPAITSLNSMAIQTLVFLVITVTDQCVDE